MLTRLARPIVLPDALLEEAPPSYWFIKRSLDIVVSALALIVLTPLMVAIAVAIWAQERSGPIFFKQDRTGLGGHRFKLLKFRTMVRDAEALKEQLRELSAVSWPDFRLENDPRVTKLGSFLRRTSLDELPQFVNVLKGDMSLVGPRPTSFDVSTYQMWHTGRLDFRPGLTGPWQVHGRSTMDFDERCRLEITFFRKPSVWREMRLLFATVGVVVKRTGVA